MTEILEILAVVLAGPLVGVEVGVAALFHPMVGRLPDEAFAAARSDGGRVLGKVMPFWYIATLVVLIATAVRSRDERMIAAAMLLGAAVVLTVSVLVPINNRIGAWTPGTAAPREPARRWDRLHWLRVAGLAVMFVLVAVGAS